MRSFAAAVLALFVVVALAACGDTGKAIDDAMNIDTDQVQNAGAGIREAAKQCSAASGKVSGVLQSFTKAVQEKDLEAAKAAGVEMQALADELHAAEAKGTEAAEGLSSLPGGAGAQAVDGTQTGFKACGNTGDEMEDLATAVASASEEDLNGKLQKQIDEVREQAMKALSELGES